MEALKRNGYMASVEVDELASNPRDKRYRDNMAVMVCFHRRYNLGDDDHGYDFRDYGCWDDMLAAIEERERPVVIKPLYMLDHSGVTISTNPFSCPWDSGRVGFVLVRRDHPELKGLHRAKAVERAEKVIECEIDEYDKYLRGEVYHLRIDRIDEDGKIVEMNVDNCGGFIGYEYAMEEAERMLDEVVANCKKNKAA